MNDPDDRLDDAGHDHREDGAGKRPLPCSPTGRIPQWVRDEAAGRPAQPAPPGPPAPSRDPATTAARWL
jgi:hypothetical protein